ncbi:unnamed protein product [Triticum turgidum subsp. durum]|uniref:Uncharacterized protein n=1 Tax=Triticum turgidum subsp. durum TaxID=4567 RepID=A0A9R0X2V8_TRITD|nr:unnamed protein product [Triticum turgidum subsp. durum]
MATNIEDVPSVELMTELLRRAKCSSKPDKRIILVGKTLALLFFPNPHLLLHQKIPTARPRLRSRQGDCRRSNPSPCVLRRRRGLSSSQRLVGSVARSSAGGGGAGPCG